MPQTIDPTLPPIFHVAVTTVCIPLSFGRSNAMLLSFAFLAVFSLSGARGECLRRGVRCLEYTVLQTHEDYEERAYPPVVWISASADAKRKMDVSRSLVKLLYAYLGGANDRGEALSMMVPFRTTKVVNGESNSYVLSIPLSPEQSDDPPIPANSNLTLSREPRTVYVTRSFGGQARLDDVWDREANALRNAVANDDSVDTSFYYMSVYDSPYQETDRLNEVWMLKKD